MSVLITGSSKGLGEALALAFAKEGHSIVLHGRDENRLKKVGEQLLKIGVGVNIVCGDLCAYKEENSVIDRLLIYLRGFSVDILINNAGLYLNSSVENMKVEEVENIMTVNFLAPVLLAKGAVEHFKNKGGGVIVNINSIAGKESSEGEALYCASKHALRGFMRSFEWEAIKSNVMVMNFYLGAMKTDFRKSKETSDKFMNPEEVADFIVSTVQSRQSIRVNEIDVLRKCY